MSALSRPAERYTARILFLTRDPVFHEQSGSTTYITGLLRLLVSHGAAVTVVSTVAQSRSPRLFFRWRAPVPAGVQVRCPGYVRFGTVFVRPLQPKAWARAAMRAASRRAWLQPLARALQSLWGTSLYAGAWDLTAPTANERRLAVQEAARFGATAVIGNYCLWGELTGRGDFAPRPTALLMHDLLHERVRRFKEKGTLLDMPPITEAEEMCWLRGADLVLAAQEREAETVRSQGVANVLVTPVVLEARALDEASVVRGRCLFVGSNIDPNRDALRFLLDEVWPRVRQQCPTATLAVAGTVGRMLSSCDASTLENQGIETLGIVPELEAEYARAAVCVVPLRLGTGIKIKLLEALSFGKATVSTDVGVQGLEAWAYEGIAVANDAPGFAHCVAEFLRNDALRANREQLALSLAWQHFGPNRPLPAAFREALFGDTDSTADQLS